MAVGFRLIEGWGQVTNVANKCVAPEGLMAEARAWAREFAAMAPVSLRLIKEELYDSYEANFDRKLNRLRL